MIVPGDTLYQTGAVKDGVSQYHFQLKNPKSEKCKAILSTEMKETSHLWDWQAPFVTFDKDLLTKKESRILR